MMIFLLLFLLAAASMVVLPRAIRSDGYGTRPGPRSHQHDAPSRRL